MENARNWDRARRDWKQVTGKVKEQWGTGLLIAAALNGLELGVRYVLEGSVRKAGGRLRITAQLIDTTTTNHIWADRYEGALEDVFDLQDRITSSVVAVIEPKVQQAEIMRAQSKSAENLTAYDL